MKTLYRKTPKNLQDLVNRLGLKLVKINYTFQGLLKQNGFDIQDETGKIIISFEPVNYSNGDKWFVRNGKLNKAYYKNMSEIFKEMKSTNLSLY